MMRFASILAAAAFCAAAACAQTTETLNVQPFQLAGTSWVAEQIPGEQMRNNQPPTLSFSESEVRGELVCNDYQGRYDTFGARGIEVRSLVYPRGACANPEVAARQQRFLSALDAASSYRLTEDGRLVLSTHDHRSLTFRRAG